MNHPFTAVAPLGAAAAPPAPGAMRKARRSPARGHSVLQCQGTRSRDLPVDVVVVVEAGSVTPQEREWIEQRGIARCEEVDFTAFAGIEQIHGRLSVATLIKLVLPNVMAGRYKILYLDTDLTIHGDVSSLFTLDLGDFPLAAQIRGQVFVTDGDRSARKHGSFGSGRRETQVISPSQSAS